MKVSETFWLTIIGMLQLASIALGVLMFFLIPKEGKRNYLELGLFLIATLIIEVVGWIGVLIFHQNVNVILHIFDFFTLPLFLLLYKRQVEWPNKNLITHVFIAAFLIFALVNLILIQGPYTANTYTRFITSFFFTIIGITYLFGVSARSTQAMRLKQPMFWISIAILIYHTSTIYIHLWQEYLVDVVKNDFIVMWMIQNALGLTHYLMISYALLLIRSQTILRDPTAN